MVGDDLGEFFLDVFRVLGLTTDTGEGRGSGTNVALLDEESRRFGKEEQAKGENESPKHLKGDGDSVGGGGSEVLGTVGDTRGEEETEGDTELVTRDEGTPDFPWRNLTHVKDDDGGDETDTETRDETTSDEL